MKNGSQVLLYNVQSAVGPNKNKRGTELTEIPKISIIPYSLGFFLAKVYLRDALSYTKPIGINFKFAFLQIYVL